MTDRLTDIIKRCELVENRDLRLKDSISPITVMAADCRWLMLREAAQRQEIADLRSLVRRMFLRYYNPAIPAEPVIQDAAKALGWGWDKKHQAWVEKREPSLDEVRGCLKGKEKA